MNTKKNVVIYKTQHCPFCHAAEKLLKDKQVEFEVISVEGDDEARQKLVERSGGRTTVPQIFVDDKSIGGYDDLVKFFQAGNSI